MTRDAQERYRLSPEEQAEKLTAWQAATDPVVRGRLITEVVQSLEGLLRSLVLQRTSTMGGSWRQQVFDDLLGDARVSAMEALVTWSPDGGAGVVHWVASAVKRDLRITDLSPGGGTVPREWRQVSQVAHAIIDEGVGGGGPPGTGELTERVQRSFWNTTRERIMEKHPGATPEEVERMVHDRLSRQSINRALREIPEILAVSEGTVSLDAAEPDGVSLHEHLGESQADPYAPEIDATSVVSQLLQGLPAKEVAVLYARYSTTGEPTVTELAANFEISKPEVKAILRNGAARVTAPHAQWCRLAPGVASRVDRLPSEEGPADRARRRISARAG